MILIRFCWRRYIHSSWRSLTIENATHLAEKRMKTCGIIVTGDEVLKGEVQDINSVFLCKRLYELGIKVVRISTLPDNLDIISGEVKKFSGAYDYVLTTGGIGPTHDDVTYEAVAKAFHVELQPNPTLVDLCFQFFNTNDINHPGLKLARVPATAKLTFGHDSVYPNISVENVFIFPGVPKFMRQIFNSVYKELFLSDCKFHFRELYLTVNEDKIVEQLNDAVSKYPEVNFGSYPNLNHSYYVLKLTAESLNEEGVENAFQYLKSSIPNSFHVNFDKNFTHDKSPKVKKLNNRLLNDTIIDLKSKLKSINPDKIFLYFDGGKNSTVLLYILTLILEEGSLNDQVTCIYVERNDMITQYITDSSKDYNINLIKVTEDNFIRFFACNSDLVLIKGTRMSDPDFQLVMESFKDFNILNPLLCWGYKDIWDVIRGLCLRYCQLYDRGYTSICHVSPKKNPYLEMKNGDIISYKKAYELSDGSLENC